MNGFTNDFQNRNSHLVYADGSCLKHLFVTNVTDKWKMICNNGVTSEGRVHIVPY